MKIFIWEGNRISDAYHNDGTLVVLAQNAEQARALVIARSPEGDKYDRLPLYKDGPWWDGDMDALEREPDRVVELTEPAVIAFNGGGYD